MTVLVILIIVAVAVFVAMKAGKVKDANNNNIPDAIETPIKAAVAEVKEIVAKVEEIKVKVKNTDIFYFNDNVISYDGNPIHFVDNRDLIDFQVLRDVYTLKKSNTLFYCYSNVSLMTIMIGYNTFKEKIILN
jgi:hypothetical protein